MTEAADSVDHSICVGSFLLDILEKSDIIYPKGRKKNEEMRNCLSNEKNERSSFVRSNVEKR